MSDVISVGLVGSPATPGPLGGSGTGSGYYDGSLNGFAATSGSATPVFLTDGTQIASIASQDDVSHTLVVALYGNLPQNYFNDIAFGGSTLLTSVATYSQQVVGFTTFSIWEWPLAAALTGASIAFTIDYTPPLSYNAPTALVAVDVEYNTVTFQWTDSTPVGGSGPPPPQYLIYRNGTLIGTSVSPTYTDTTVAVSTTYSYTVAAGDGAGIAISAQSSAFPLTTPALPIISLFGRFANAPAFKPIAVAQLGSAKPRIYPPLENRTIRSRS